MGTSRWTEVAPLLGSAPVQLIRSAIRLGGVPDWMRGGMTTSATAPALVRREAPLLQSCGVLGRAAPQATCIDRVVVQQWLDERSVPTSLAAERLAPAACAVVAFNGRWPSHRLRTKASAAARTRALVRGEAPHVAVAHARCVSGAERSPSGARSSKRSTAAACPLDGVVGHQVVALTPCTGVRTASRV
jgi:hypothetical protein